MEAFKIDNFTRAHSNLEFPSYRSLLAEETEKVRRRIAERLRLPQESSPLELVRALREKSTTVPGISAESEDFDLESVITNATITSLPLVFLNWNRFDEIDEIELSNLSRYFDDIWYPAADDIDVFDETLDWLISIDYSGEVLVHLFSQTEG